MYRIGLVSIVVAAMLAGCQSYAPQPLDSAAHRALWEARAADVERLRTFAATLSPQEAPAEFALDDGVSMIEGEVIALAFNPELRAARAEVAVALAGAKNAGLWEDPTLTLDVMKIVESVPEPWVIGGMIGFTIPLSGRLGAERAMADAEHQTAVRRVVEREWRVRNALRAQWAEWSATRLQVELLKELLQREADILGVVDRLEAAQSLSRLEGRLFRMERASRQSELLLLESRERELALQLRFAMGLTPDAAVDLAPQVAAADATSATPPDDIFLRLEQRNPELIVQRAEYDVAERSLNLEVRKQYPDLEIGPAYEADEGQNKIGLGLGLPLPILNANRQGIAVARAKRDAARIAYETLHERLVSEYTQAQARHASASAARQMLERELLPLADAQIAAERRLADLGELNVLLTLEGIVRAHETRVRLIDATLAESRAAFRLKELLGPDDSAAATPMEIQR